MPACPRCRTNLQAASRPRCGPGRDPVWAEWAGTQPFASDLGAGAPGGVQRFAAWRFNPALGRHEVVEVGAALEPLLARHAIPADRVVTVGRA